MPLKIVFFGTPEFAAHTLAYLLDNGINVVAVITKPDAPKGRSKHPLPTPVKEYLQNKHPEIPLFQPPIVSAIEFAPTIAEFKADLFVVVAYGEIIKQHLLDMPRLGCINLHASLLPKYRGAAPIQHSIINGDPKTGATIMYMVKKMDAGDMIKKVEISIGPNDIFPEIEKRLCQEGSKALLEVIRAFEHGPVSGIAQDSEAVTLAPKIELEDCELQWTRPAKVLHNLIRAVTPEPGAWCYVTVRGERKRLKIYSSEVVDMLGKPGEILAYDKRGLIIGCGEHALKILELQLEGKKSMTAEALVCGIQKDQISFIS